MSVTYTPPNTYPFDPTGLSVANKIQNEQQIITAVNGRDYHYIIPDFAPFFADGLVMTFKYPDGSTRTLTEGVDYYLSNEFISASRATAKPVYGSIEFLDTSLAGVVKLQSYQSLGGIWTLPNQAIAEILANELRNPRTTAWEQIVYLPSAFPVIDHEWNLTDMVGASEVVQELQNITDAITNSIGSQQNLQAHVTNFSNPHQVTKAQIGLGNVLNYGLATPSLAAAGADNTTYMTPYLTAVAINALSASTANVTAHLQDYNNPHHVTSAQVGLGNVQNYAVADAATALAGSSNNTYMTPYLTAQVVGVVNTSLSNHLADHLNPHQVTAVQVGLGNVLNYGVATIQDATAGTSNVLYMTPLRVSQAITALALTPLNQHENDTTNPHSVSKSQIGLGSVDNFGTASFSEAQTSTVANKFMTPYTTWVSIEYFVGTAFADHLAAVNPHQVTAAQIGLSNVQNYSVATTAEAQSGTIDSAYMTPLKTAQAIGQFLGAHTSDYNNPHQVTAAQVGLGNVPNFAAATDAQAIDGTNATALMTPRSVALAIEANQQTANLSSIKSNFIRSFTNDPLNVQPDVWFKLGTLTAMLPTTAESDELQAAKSDAYWIVMGGDNPDLMTGGSMYNVHVSIQGNLESFSGPVIMEVRPQSQFATYSNNFGYVWDGSTGTVTVYLRANNGSNPITTVNLNQAGVVFGPNARYFGEPEGIVYVVGSSSAYSADTLGGFAASDYELAVDHSDDINTIITTFTQLTQQLLGS
jgi:hypothetical protein